MIKNFYGNIESPFVFDIIYDSEIIMRNSAATDGVFVGRYVLLQEGEKSTIYQKRYNHEEKVPAYFYIGSLTPQIIWEEHFEKGETNNE